MSTSTILTDIVYRLISYLLEKRKSTKLFRFTLQLIITYLLLSLFDITLPISFNLLLTIFTILFALFIFSVRNVGKKLELFIYDSLHSLSSKGEEIREEEIYEYIIEVASGETNIREYSETGELFRLISWTLLNIVLYWSILTIGFIVMNEIIYRILGIFMIIRFNTIETKISVTILISFLLILLFIMFSNRHGLYGDSNKQTIKTQQFLSNLLFIILLPFFSGISFIKHGLLAKVMLSILGIIVTPLTPQVDLDFQITPYSDISDLTYIIQKLIEQKILEPVDEYTLRTITNYTNMHFKNRRKHPTIERYGMTIEELESKTPLEIAVDVIDRLRNRALRLKTRNNGRLFLLFYKRSGNPKKNDIKGMLVIIGQQNIVRFIQTLLALKLPVKSIFNSLI